MNTHQTEGIFEQIKGDIKKAWGRLTDNDIMLYNGQQDKFFGKIKELYGTSQKDAEKRIESFHKMTGSSSAKTTDAK